MSVALNPEAPEFLPANLESSIETGLTTMSRTIRLSNKLPVGIAYKKYEIVPDFNSVTQKFNQNVVFQLNSILVTEQPSLKLTEKDVEYNTERLIFANDSILDRVNNHIDCLNKGIQPSDHNINPIITTIKVGSATFTGGKNIILPQLLFKDKVDNSSSLWVPKISDKPNNIRPLALQIHYNEHGEAIGYEHPYETELSHFQPRPEWLILDLEEMPIPPPPEETKLTYVATEVELNELLKHLETVEELGVDLEHHSYRSYQGFTCLIQITTTAGDFVVDALALREHLHKLNEVFTNPKKLKIFHGANLDVQWLQRDFGVYVVGMFDTHQAAIELNIARKSLAALLKRYCDLDIDKTYQLADWRLRPLTDEMMHYARSDTHYLLYIWRRMRTDLLALDGGNPQRLLAVFESSRKVCCLTYNKPVLKEDSHMALYYRSKKQFNSQQMAALIALYGWRNEQARALDESTMYLLPSHMLLALAEILPRDVQGVTALCSPTPPFVKQNLFTIHRMILSCRELPLEPLVTGGRWGLRAARVEPPQPVYDVHDMQEHEDREEAPRQDTTAASPTPPPQSVVIAKSETKQDAKKLEFLSPHERYRGYRTLTKYEGKHVKDAKVTAIVKGNENEQLKTEVTQSEPPVDIEIQNTIDPNEQNRKLRAATDCVDELSTNDTKNSNRESCPDVQEIIPPAEVLLGGLKKKNKNKKSHKKNQRYNLSAPKVEQKEQLTTEEPNNKNPTFEVIATPKKNSSRKKKQQDNVMAPSSTQGYQHATLSKTGSGKKTNSRDSSQKRNQKPYDYENASYIKFLETKKTDKKTHKHKK